MVRTVTEASLRGVASEKLASYQLSGAEGGGDGGVYPSMDVLPPKRQAVVDRLRRRIENYRRHQNDCIPRFDQSFNGAVEQNIQDTLVLKQRFLESKAKRAAKKSDKKPSDSSTQSNVHSLPVGGFHKLISHIFLCQLTMRNSKKSLTFS